MGFSIFLSKKVSNGCMVGEDADLGPNDVRSELSACKYHRKHLLLYGSVVQLRIVEGPARVINGPKKFLLSLA